MRTQVILCVHLSKMVTPKLKLLLLPTAIVMIILILATMTVATDNDPSGSSVDIFNNLNETFALHCSSKDNDFGEVAIFPKTSYYWKFDPNIFGRTVYNCDFMWKNKKQEFPVWQGSNYDQRLSCCARGPCSYKVCADGIYNANTISTDDNTLAEEWVFYKAWYPNYA